MLSELPANSLGAYVISMAKTASDVLAVMLLQRECGVREVRACVCVRVCVCVRARVCVRPASSCATETLRTPQHTHTHTHTHTHIPLFPGAARGPAV